MIFFQSALVLVPKLKGGAFTVGIVYIASDAYCAFCQANLSSEPKCVPPPSLFPNLTSIFFTATSARDEESLDFRKPPPVPPAPLEAPRFTVGPAVLALLFVTRFVCVPPPILPVPPAVLRVAKGERGPPSAFAVRCSLFAVRCSLLFRRVIETKTRNVTYAQPEFPGFHLFACPVPLLSFSADFSSLLFNRFCCRAYAWTTVINATSTSQSVRRNHEDGIVRACGGGLHRIALDPGIRGSGDGPGEGFFWA